MAFGFGPGSEMMKSVKSNRKQLSKTRSLKEVHDRYKDVINEDAPNFKKVSEKELEAFKAEFLEKKKKEDLNNKIITGCVVITILVAFYFLMYT